MTYEEKFDLVIKVIYGARKITPKGYYTKLKITRENKLEGLDLDDISSILLKIQEIGVIEVMRIIHKKIQKRQLPIAQ